MYLPWLILLTVNFIMYFPWLIVELWNIADKQKGNNIDTEYLRNGCIFLAAIF